MINIPRTLPRATFPQWDSIAHVNLIQRTEAEFNVNFEIHDALAIEDVSDLVRIVEEYVGA